MTAPTIRRRDLLAALKLLGIGDTDHIARIDMTPQAITVTRYVRSMHGGIMLDLLRDEAATRTERIEIR